MKLNSPQSRSQLFACAILAVALGLPARSMAAPKSAKEAQEAAGRNGQYTFLVFHDKADEALKSLVKQLEEYAPTNTAKPALYQALVSNPSEAEWVTKYGLNRGASLPLVLIMAPNGVVTGGFPTAMVTADNLQRCVSQSELALTVLKPLQERKIVLLSLQNATTRFNAESSQAVREFADDPQLKPYVALLSADPAADQNKEFLNQCKLTEKIDEATVLFLVPPASLVKTFSGSITKTNLMTALAACSSGSGCCPSR